MFIKQTHKGICIKHIFSIENKTAIQIWKCTVYVYMEVNVQNVAFHKVKCKYCDVLYVINTQNKL